MGKKEGRSIFCNMERSISVSDFHPRDFLLHVDVVGAGMAALVGISNKQIRPRKLGFKDAMLVLMVLVSVGVHVGKGGDLERRVREVQRGGWDVWSKASDCWLEGDSRCYSSENEILDHNQVS